MAKPRKGQLLWRRSGWSGRYLATIDGESVRVCVPLGTDNKSVARTKLDRLLAGTDTPATVTAPETFEQAARRIVPTQRITTGDERLRRLETYAFPLLGRKPVTAIRAGDIRAVLDLPVAQGRSRGMVTHLLNDISSVLGTLWKYDVIPENPAKKVDVSKDAVVDHRHRVVLTDAEFEAFMAWPELHPELQLLCLTARCFGGMRTSDLHAWDWGHIDTQGWVDAHVPRPKTKTRDRLGLPAVMVPSLQAWWQAAGRPGKGPVFPKWRTGGGEQRKLGSHAARLRIALWRAGVRRGATPAECELQTDTADTKRVDFHSFRRAFNTALASAGVNVQTAMKLAGHRNPTTHMRYVRLVESIEMPLSALPRLGRARPVPEPGDPGQLSTGKWLAAPASTVVRARPSEDPTGSVFVGFEYVHRPGRTPYDRVVPIRGARSADAALRAYLRAAADELAAGLGPDGITS